MAILTDEERLAALMASVSKDPLAFVRLSFPWGEPGTELANYQGPEDWQIRVLEDIKNGLKTPNEIIQEAVAAANGVGKAQAYDDVVPTPCGMRRWGDLEPGDAVFGADGRPAEILQCHHYTAIPMYRVTFDDGSFAEVSSGHLWNVRGKRERRRGIEGYRTAETLTLLNEGVRYNNGSANGARQWEIPIQGAAHFEPKATPLHPYLVGVWLGDGSKGKPGYTKPSEEVANKLRSFGYDVHDHPDGRSKYIRGIMDHFKEGVFLLGSSERYIPDEYKFNCVAARRALLEGLLDTDGEVGTQHSVGYASTSLRLAEDVIWLARSLGCKAMMQPTVKKGWYPDENGERVICRDCYRVTINSPFNPFTTEHKRNRYRPAQQRYLTRWVDSIEPLEPSDGMCISVAAKDGLYQMGDFIVTHNSAVVSWLILWGLSTFPGTKIVVTANTEGQLRTKTWPELSRWFRLFIAKHWFRMTATAVFSVDPDYALEWRADAIPWSETNPQAFAGLHNQNKRLILIMDEASEINDIIWETAEGAMTDADTEILWCVFGNPTLNTGRFRECFDRFAHRWNHHHVDSRDCRITNKAQIAKWKEDYGEDDDWFRIHVRGVFPRFGSRQFISGELVRAAMSPERFIQPTVYDPLIMSADIARFGDNKTVIAFRRGRDARSIPMTKLSGADTMTVAARIAELFEEHHPDALFVDEGGVGGGVVDRLRMLKLPVLGVQFGRRATNTRDMGTGPNNYYNVRSEIYGLCRDWLNGGMLPNDKELLEGLSAPLYTYRSVDGVDCILLEKKEDIKNRLPTVSLDEADALCFEAGTLIRVPGGVAPIESLAVGDEVTTPFGTARVAIKWLSQTDRMTTAEFSNGSILRGKGEHKIFIWGEGKRRLDALNMTDVVEPYSIWRLRAWRSVSTLFTKVANIGFRQAVDIITVAENMKPATFFIAACGWTLTEKFQKVWKYTTKTVIGAIMPSLIWRLLKSGSTTEYMAFPSGKIPNSEKECWWAWNERDWPHQSGMLRQKDFYGTASTVKRLGLDVNQSQQYVNSVVGSSSHISPPEQNIAQSPVGQRKSTLILLQIFGSALGAVKNFWRAVIGKWSVVPVRVVTKRVAPCAVYNLTLDRDNAYYANDILVYNCISFAYPVQKTDHTSIIARGRKYGLEAEYSPYASAWNQAKSEIDDKRRSWLPGSHFGSRY